MNGRSLAFASIIGTVAGLGYAMLLGKGDIMSSCMGNSLLVSGATFVAAMFAPLFYSRVPSTGGAVLQGAVHAICAAGLATIATWVVVSQLTSDETINARTTQFFDSVDRLLDKADAAQLEQAGDDPREKIDELREMLEANPQQVRWSAIVTLLSFTFFAAPLIGAFAGWLGFVSFKNRLQQRVGEPEKNEQEWWTQ